MTLSAHAVALENCKTTIEAANLHHSSLIPRGLVMVKGGSLGAVAEAISPLMITSPQAP